MSYAACQAESFNDALAIQQKQEERIMKTGLMIIVGFMASVGFVTTAMAKEEVKSATPEIGRRIVITGCVHKGTEMDSYLMLGVTERPVDPGAAVTPVPIAIYWLDSVKALEPLVGKMVEVTGKVSSHDANSGTITIDIDPSVKLSTDVKVASDSKDYTTEKFDDRPRETKASSSKSSLIVDRPVYNLTVENVNSLGSGPSGEPCQFKEKVVIQVSEMPEPKVEEKVKALAADAKAEEKIIILAFEDLHFDFDKSTLTPEAQAILKRNVQLLKDNPKTKVRIAGYTSASGTEDYNQKLSVRRAQAVSEYLVKEGVVSSRRLSTIGYGETNPADYEAAPQALYSAAAKANMRVLFEIVVK
jgi:outer membrane protein OmpA-like peptidoglycan-associated protein